MLFSRQIRIMCGLPGLAVFALCLLLLGGFQAAALAQAQPSCDTELNDAENKYYAGRFDEAIDLVDRCLAKTGLTDATLLRAYRLKALAYQAKDYLFQAQNAIKRLLELVPTYEPNPEQEPPQYIELVRRVKEELKKAEQAQKPAQPQQSEQPTTTPSKKKGGATKWLLIGGGVGVAAIAAVALSGGGGGNGNGTVTPQPLPTPPDLP
jgi:tetratricopeptide (TPR) repeat protein